MVSDSIRIVYITTFGYVKIYILVLRYRPSHGTSRRPTDHDKTTSITQPVWPTLSCWNFSLYLLITDAVSVSQGVWLNEQ